jgi:SRSO17 transposase
MVSSLGKEISMKSSHSTTSKQAEQILRQVSYWPVRLRELHQQLRPRFARPEAFQHSFLYLQAILSDIPRKNGWQIAEQARQARPYGMQRLLCHAIWDQDGVRDDLRTLVSQTLQPLPVCASHEPLWPVLVIDESGILKRGRHSAGVAPQYCGLTGRVENCQMGVFLSYVTALGHGLIDRELYLPEDWCADLPRRRAAHIPDRVSFATKPELAKRMVERAQAAGLPISWVVADTVYGHSPDLRLFLQEQGYAYALAVPSIEVVCVQTRTGFLLSDVASIAHQALRAHDWQRLSQSLGTKGERLFDWARLPVVHAGAVDGRNFLVVRRCLDNPDELAYYLVCAPSDTPLSTMVQAIGARWRIEEDLEANKGLGLDQYARAQLPGLVSSYHPGVACLCLPAQYHRPEPLHGFCSAGGCDLPLAHPFDHLRSPAPAGPSVLSCSHVLAADLSVVTLSASPPILGWLLPSSPSPESWLGLPVKPVFAC